MEVPPSGTFFQVCTQRKALIAQEFRIREKEHQMLDEIKIKAKRDVLHEKKILKEKIDSGFYKLNPMDQYRSSLEANRMETAKSDEKARQSINMILKTDTYGSLEAIVESVSKYRCIQTNS